MESQELKTGAPLPGFKNLPGVDGRKYSADDFRDARVLVVVFSCNHCPYVQAYEDRMIAFQKQYAARGVRLVAVNSNETIHYPEDNFDEMVRRAQAKGYNFPYVRDEDQSVAEAFGATHTPQFFVFAPEGGGGPFTLRYSGKLDDNYREPGSVTRRYLQEATDAILEGKPVAEPSTFSIGCTIKWR